MRRLFSITVLLLIYLMTPTSAEISQRVMQFVAPDTAAQAETSHRAHGCEHGCSGPYHVCWCHHSDAFTTADATMPVPSLAPTTSYLESFYEAAPPEGTQQGVFRPPSA